jgi:hypothetical protein
MVIGEELGETLRCFGRRIGRGDADDVKALRTRIGCDRFLRGARNVFDGDGRP